MAGVASRESYFEAGLDVLSDSGYGGLKLAVVCGRLGVTTGSFYHYFSSWSAYTKDLLDHWVTERNLGMAVAYAEPDPRRRIGALIENALLLPHGAEAAIRVWSSIDPEVYAVQAAVDRQRFDALFDAALKILEHERQARVFASWGMYVLIGYEQSTIPRNAADLRWIADQLLDTLDSGRFGLVPDAD
jgi:AcrR family transcriptional regulator